MTNQIKNDFDIIVIGGGLAGLTLCSLLAESPLKIACIDKDSFDEQSKPLFDGRTTAISYGSQKVLSSAKVWDKIKLSACPITDIQILDGDSPVLLNFSSEEVGGKIFGWIAENSYIRHTLFEKINELDNVTHIAPDAVVDFSKDEEFMTVHLSSGNKISAKLVIGADGRGSFTRKWMGISHRSWSYHQRAIVCTVNHEHPHQNIAVEHFRKDGPFAILPMTDSPGGLHRSSVVWTEHCKDKDSAIHYSDAVFNAALTERFPNFYGNVKQIEHRFSYPLGLIHAHKYISHRMALVAEAAHGIHPIAGQGLNMGFRDIAVISELIFMAHNNNEDIGSQPLLSEYQRKRRFDNMAMAGATDNLNKLFSNSLPLVSLGRKAGLRAVSNLPFAKKFFMKQAMGGGILTSLNYRASEE